MRVRLTEKDEELLAKIAEIEDSYSETLRGDSSTMSEIESATETLRRNVRTWGNCLNYLAL